MPLSLSEEILEHVEKLPESFQSEVLDFVEYLESKVGRGIKRVNGDEEWSRLSLSFAMEGMEDESSPYSVEDIKEKFT